MENFTASLTIMKKFFFLLILLFLLFLELVWGPHLSIGLARPNFILIGFLVCFLTLGVKATLEWYFPFLLFLDFSSSLPFGVVTLSFLLVIFLIRILSLKLFRERDVSAIILVTILGSIIYNLALITLVKLFNWMRLSDLQADLFYDLKYLVLPTIFYNLVVTVFSYRILKYCYSVLLKTEEQIK